MDIVFLQVSRYISEKKTEWTGCAFGLDQKIGGVILFDLFTSLIYLLLELKIIIILIDPMYLGNISELELCRIPWNWCILPNLIGHYL